MSASPEVPAFLGGFKLMRTWAHGAMGELHQATDPASGLPVAIKTVRFTGHELSRERFLNEAQAAARLRHPAIVATYGAGVEGDGDGALGWIAMEWLPGHSLDHHLAPPHRLSDAQAVDLAARVAHGLAYAHAAGIVHRDIKPANIMLHQSSGRVSITDFGCAHLSDAERSRSGLLLGSPMYMAPEQLLGAGVDGRCDVYALGAVLYELLAGRPPLQAVSLGELMEQIARHAPPPLTRLRPDLPALLSDVLARALAKRPQERQPTAARLARELRVVARALATLPMPTPVLCPEPVRSGHNG